MMIEGPDQILPVHGEVAVRSTDGGGRALRPTPSTIRFANGPPPHDVGRIFAS